MSEQTTSVQRGPGRPRKPKAVETAAQADPAEGRPRVIHGREVGRILGVSPSTVSRMVRRDPDFPAPFALAGMFACYWVEAEVLAYVKKRAEAAQRAKAERFGRLRESKPKSCKAGARTSNETTA
jgi:predicted DNA-binding transcriptional regulator AlpA